MKKILIIGSKGMAGHVIKEYFRLSGQFLIADIARGNNFFEPVYNLDITDTVRLTEVILDFKPDIVINCIGVLNKDAEENPEKAIFINSYLPHFLAKQGSDIGYKLVHISTDCVFSGKTGGYTENAVKDGIGFYAQSKALGEIVYGKHLTIRTSIIGPELKTNGIGLFDWVMQQKGEINGYINAYWTGVTTMVLAQAILSGIAHDISGLHHLVNDKKINKHHLISIIKKEFNRDDITIVPYMGYQTDKSLVRTNKEILFEVPEYDAMLKEMYNWMISRPETYSRYFK